MQVRASVFIQLANTFPAEDPRYEKLLDYFCNTYIGQLPSTGRTGIPRTGLPLFPFPIWNHYKSAATRAPKTTNGCEGFHSQLKILFRCSRPDVFTVFKVLKKNIAVQRLKEVHYEQGRRGNQPRPKYVRLNIATADAVQTFYDTPDKLEYLWRQPRHRPTKTSNVVAFSTKLYSPCTI